MKRILLILSVLFSFVAASQPNYTRINGRYNWLGVGTDAFNLPGLGTPALATAQMVRAGALVYDSTGGNRGVHVWTGAAWVKLYDTTMSVGTPLAITNPIVSGTSGSVLYAGANGLLQQSNSKFFFDSTNSRLAINTTAPSSRLHLLTDAIGVTQSDAHGIFLSNTTAAAVGAQQTSPPLIFSGRGWKTIAGGASQIVNARIDLLPTQGSGAPNGLLQFGFSVNGAAYTVPASISNVGAFIGLTFNSASLGLVGSDASSYRFGTSTALGSLTSGTNNVAVGGASLTLLTTGSFNTSVGHLSLNQNTASLNTAVGYSAMSANTTGDQNSAFGVNALVANTIGVRNTALGGGAMEENIDGDDNTGIGHDALLHNSTGSNNSALGRLAGAGNLTGSSNTSIGWRAGAGQTSGDNNLFLGAAAGDGSQTAAVSGTIVLGVNAFSTQDNQMVLGHTTLTETKIRGITYNTPASAMMLVKDTLTDIIYHQAIPTGGGGSGVDALSAIGATPNANAATITGTTLNLEPASASFGGVVTTGPQTFAGVKTLATPSFTTGFTIGGAATTGTFPRGNGTNFIQSTLVLPNAATANYIPFATATNTWGESSALQFDDVSKVMKITGTSANLALMPRFELVHTGSTSALISYLAYSADNVSLMFDAKHNNTTYVSNHAGANFALYKTGSRLTIQTNTGTAQGSTFGGFTEMWGIDGVGNILHKFGNYSIGNHTATGSLHIRAGTTSLPSIVINEGARKTTPIDGAFEKDDAFYMTKTNAVRYGVGGTLNSQYTAVGNVGTGEDTLMAYSILGGTLSQDGDFIEYTMLFSSSGDNVSRVIKIYLESAGAGAITILSGTTSDEQVVIHGTITRTSATTFTHSITGSHSGPLAIVGFLSSNATWSGAVRLKATGESVTTDDIVQRQLTVKYNPAN